MADALSFTTAKRAREAIPFTLDGEEYQFTPPKDSIMVMPLLDGGDAETGAMRGLFDWLGAGLPQEQTDRIITRLKDPEDDLDIDTLTEVIKGLQEAVSGGRPTT